MVARKTTRCTLPASIFLIWSPFTYFVAQIMEALQQLHVSCSMQWATPTDTAAVIAQLKQCVPNSNSTAAVLELPYWANAMSATPISDLSPPAARVTPKFMASAKTTKLETLGGPFSHFCVFGKGFQSWTDELAGGLACLASGGIKSRGRPGHLTSPSSICLRWAAGEEG